MHQAVTLPLSGSFMKAWCPPKNLHHSGFLKLKTMRSNLQLEAKLIRGIIWASVKGRICVSSCWIFISDWRRSCKFTPASCHRSPCDVSGCFLRWLAGSDLISRTVGSIVWLWKGDRNPQPSHKNNPNQPSRTLMSAVLWYSNSTRRLILTYFSEIKHLVIVILLQLKEPYFNAKNVLII